MMSQTTNAEKITRYEAYIKADPDNTLLWISLADLYHANGQFEKAIACYEKTLMLDENNHIAQARLANVMISQNKFAEAEHLLSSIISDGSSEPELTHNLGLAIYYQKRWQDALRLFKQAEALGLKHTNNTAYQVYCHHHLGNKDEALERANIWVNARPGPKTEGYVAMLEMDLGEHESARQRAQKVLTENPENADAQVVMGTWCIEKQENQAAITHFEAITKHEPDNPRGWQGLGLSYLYEQETEKSIKHLEKALQLMPDNGTTLLTLGWATLVNKDAVGAEKIFRDAISIDRNFAESHGGLASALVMQNKKSEARESVKTAMRLDPENFGAIFANSILLKLQGKDQMGTKMLSKLLERSPRDGSQPLINYIQNFYQQRGAQDIPRKKLPAGANE